MQEINTFAWDPTEKLLFGNFGGHITKCVAAGSTIKAVKDAWDKADFAMFGARNLRRWEIEVQRQTQDRRRMRAARRAVILDKRAQKAEARKKRKDARELQAASGRVPRPGILDSANLSKLFSGGVFDSVPDPAREMADFHYGLDDDDDDDDVEAARKPTQDEVFVQQKGSEASGVVMKLKQVLKPLDMERHYRADGSAFSNVLNYYFTSIGTRPKPFARHIDDWILYQQCQTCLSAHHIKTGELLWEIQEYDQRCMVFYNEKIYVGNGDGTVMCFDQRTGENKWTKIVHDAGITSIGVHKRTGRVISAAEDGSVVATTAYLRRRAWMAKDHRRGRILHLIIDEARDKLMTASVDGTVRAYHIASGGSRWVVKPGGPISYMCLDRFRGSLLVCGVDPKFTCYDVDSGISLWTSEPVHQAKVTAIACSEYWGMTFSGDENGLISAWATENGQQLWMYKEFRTAIETIIADRRNQILLALTVEGVLGCWDLQSGKPMWHIPHSNPDTYTLVTDTHFLQERKLINTIVINGSLHARSMQTLRYAWHREGAHFDYIRTTAIDHKSAILITGGGDGRVRGWSLKTGFNIWTGPKPHTDDITFVLVDVKRKLAYSGSFDRDIKCYDLNTGDIQWQVEGASHPTDPDVLASIEQERIVEEARKRIPLTVGEVFSRYDPNRNRLSESKESPGKSGSRNTGEEEELWSPLGKSPHAEVPVQRPVRAYMMAGSILKKPPRIAVREMHDYGLAWGYDNPSNTGPVAPRQTMMGNTEALGLGTDDPRRRIALSAIAADDAANPQDNQKLDLCLPGRQKHLPPVTRPRVPWEDSALVGRRKIGNRLSDASMESVTMGPGQRAGSSNGRAPHPARVGAFGAGEPGEPASSSEAHGANQDANDAGEPVTSTGESGKRGPSKLGSLSALLKKLSPRNLLGGRADNTPGDPETAASGEQNGTGDVGSSGSPSSPTVPPTPGSPKKKKRRRKKGEESPPPPLRQDRPIAPPGEGGHNTPITCGAIDLERGLLFTGGKDQLVKCWDSVRGTLQWESNPHRGEVRVLIADSPSGLVFSTAGEKIRAWDAETGKLRWDNQAHFGRVNMLVVDPISRILFSVKGAEVKKWILETGAPAEGGTGRSCCGGNPEVAVSYNAGSPIHKVEAYGPKSTKKRMLLVVTSEYVDLVNLFTFQRVDRVRMLLGPLVSAHVTCSGFFNTPSRLWGVDEEGEVQCMLLQTRYSWHRTALSHHSITEWSDADRRQSVSAWKTELIIAFIIVVVEWLQMMSLMYPEQENAVRKFTVPEPMSSLDDNFFHNAKTFGLDNEDNWSYSASLAVSLIFTASLMTIAFLQDLSLELIFRFPWHSKLKTGLWLLDLWGKIAGIVTPLPVMNVYWKAFQCNYFDDPGDRFIAVTDPVTGAPDIVFRKSNFTATWLIDPEVECYSSAHLPFVLIAIAGGLTFLCLLIRLAKARYKLVGIKGGMWGIFACRFSRDAVSRPNRGVADFERSHPLKLMCGKHGLNFLFIKVFITWLAVIFYKFPQAIAGFMLATALWMIIFSHRWPPYAFNLLNRVRLALDYGLAWLYVVGAVTVLYYTNAFEWLINKMLPIVPGIGISEEDGPYDMETGADDWDYYLQVTPVLVIPVIILGFFSEFIDRGFGRCCCVGCRSCASDRFWVEKDERVGCCGRLPSIDDDEDEEPQEAKLQINVVTDTDGLEQQGTFDEERVAAGEEAMIQAADGIERIIRLEDKMHGRAKPRIGPSRFYKQSGLQRWFRRTIAPKSKRAGVTNRTFLTNLHEQERLDEERKARRQQQRKERQDARAQAALAKKAAEEDKRLAALRELEDSDDDDFPPASERKPGRPIGLRPPGRGPISRQGSAASKSSAVSAGAGAGAGAGAKRKKRGRQSGEQGSEAKLEAV